MAPFQVLAWRAVMPPKAWAKYWKTASMAFFGSVVISPDLVNSTPKGLSFSRVTPIRDSDSIASPVRPLDR